MYNGFIFDEKGVFYILTAFSSFTENVSINSEHKNFKNLIMLKGFPIILFQNILFFKEFLACNDCFGLFTKIKEVWD